MHRRTLLKLGAASAAVLAIAGGGVALLRPGLEGGRLSASGRTILRSIGAAMLEGTLPAGAAGASALDGLLERVDRLVSGLPPHAQADLSQLLALLHTAAGRRSLGGLATSWQAATVHEVQQALQAMRLSRLALRRQAYQALHDIVSGAYFSGPATWPGIGYPGPARLAPA